MHGLLMAARCFLVADRSRWESVDATWLCGAECKIEELCSLAGCAILNVSCGSWQQLWDR